MPQQDNNDWTPVEESAPSGWEPVETPKEVPPAKKSAKATDDAPGVRDQIASILNGRKFEQLSLPEKTRIVSLGFGEKAQQESNQAFGPESQQHGMLNRAWHEIKSLLDTTAETALKPVAGLEDPKTAAVAASGAIAPEIPAAKFGIDAARQLIPQAKEAGKHTTPGNVQDLLLTASQLLMSPAAAKTDVETATTHAENARPGAGVVRGILGFGPDVTEEAVKKAGEGYIDESKKVAAKKTEQNERSALQTDADSMSGKLGEAVKAAEQTARTEGNNRYRAVQEAIGDRTRPSTVIVDAVNNAKTNILRTPENIAIFKDILAKAPEEEVQTSAGVTRPGEPLYEQLVQEGAIQADSPVTFKFLQGVFSKTSRLLSRGNLPGDVYQAVKSVHDAAGSEMKALAQDAGAESQLTEAQAYWSDMMKTFADKDSAVAQVLRNTGKFDPEHYSSPLTKGKAAKRGIDMLRKYDPKAAQLAESIRQTDEKIGEIAKAKGKIKEPEKPTVDIRNAKTAALDKLKHTIRGLSRYDLNRLTFMGLGTLTGLVEGGNNPIAAIAGGVGAEVLYFAGRRGMSVLLDKPAVVEWLTRPQPGDVEIIRQLPEEIQNAVRVEMNDVLKEQQAHSKDIKPTREIQQFLNEKPMQDNKKKKSDRDALLEQGNEVVGSGK